PPQDNPAGADRQAKPEATSAAANPPGVALPLASQLIDTPETPLNPNATSESLATVEYSPALAKRNEVPQEPRKVRPAVSSTSQVNATLGLLVPPLNAPLGLEY